VLSTLLSRGLELGPFQADFHRNRIAAGLADDLAAFVDREVVPQLTITPTGVEGRLTAKHDNDANCGPNSAVKNLYHLKLIFSSPEGKEGLDVDLVYRPPSFAPSRGRPLVVWTVAKLEHSRRCRERLDEIWRSFRAGELSTAQCPNCSASLRMHASATLLAVGCPSGCVDIDEHRDPTGAPLHGHFFMGDTLLGLPSELLNGPAR